MAKPTTVVDISDYMKIKAAEPAAVERVNVDRYVYDPLDDDRILTAMAQFLTLGEVHPEGRASEYIEMMDEQKRMDYGVLSPILFARVPCRVDDRVPIYRIFMQDARVPRIAQIVAAAWLNRRTIKVRHIGKMIGRTDAQLCKQLGLRRKRLTIHRLTPAQCIKTLKENDCIEELPNGRLVPTRRLLYFMLETIEFLADRLGGFIEYNSATIAKAWNADGTTSWLASTKAIPKREMTHDVL